MNLQINKRLNKILSVFAIAFIFAGGATISFAQSNGSLSGTVSDTTGALVQGATVTVKNVATNAERTVVTNEDGRWTITVLPVGTYSISYQKEGFQKAVNENIEVEASVPRTLDAALTVGGTENVVTKRPETFYAINVPIACDKFIL